VRPSPLSRGGEYRPGGGGCGAGSDAASLAPCSLAGVLVTLWIIDRLGRKKTMALCFVVFSFCSLLLFICVGRYVMAPALCGQLAYFSAGGQWLFGPAGCGLHPLGVI